MSSSRPGFCSFAEVVFPHHKSKHLIGTPELETKAGVGLTAKVTGWAPEIGLMLSFPKR